jgi:hypothetical protein
MNSGNSPTTNGRRPLPPRALVTLHNRTPGVTSAAMSTVAAHSRECETGISVGSRRGAGSYRARNSCDSSGVTETPAPSICQRDSGGKHCVPTRTAIVVPRCPPAGNTCVLSGSRDGTGCATAAALQSTMPAHALHIASFRLREQLFTSNHPLLT